MRTPFKIILILLVIGGIILLSLLIKGKIMRHSIGDRTARTSAQKPDNPKEVSPGRDDLEKTARDTARGMHKDRNGKSSLSQRDQSLDQKMKKGINIPASPSDISESSDLPGIFEVKLEDIAVYDPIRQGYILKDIDLFIKDDIRDDLLSLLKVLNRKDMPPDYFRSHDYQTAYREIDLFYHDTYIWPFFTNTEAKINFFLHQFSRYAADNEEWRYYEKDRSDCSQFSQRIYLFLSPEEIFMPDRNYFLFLFSNMENRAERKKLCNKIPAVFYTTLTPYVLKKDFQGTSPPVQGHAMISFAPDNQPKNWILAEPQNGTFIRYGEDVTGILSEEYTQHSLICKLGKILDINSDESHEANIETAGVYFIPSAGYEDKRFRTDDPRMDYDYQPVRMEDQTYRIFRLISYHLGRVVNKESINRMDLLRTLESISWAGDPSGLRWQEAVESSVDTMMYGLMDLEKSDLRRIQREMKALENLSGARFGISSGTHKSIKKFSYLLHLKMKPFL
ncbi:MAG: hypothetical protein ACMUIM_10195 [bacterium]